MESSIPDSLDWIENLTTRDDILPPWYYFSRDACAFLFAYGTGTTGGSKKKAATAQPAIGSFWLVRRSLRWGQSSCYRHAIPIGTYSQIFLNGRQSTLLCLFFRGDYGHHVSRPESHSLPSYFYVLLEAYCLLTTGANSYEEGVLLTVYYSSVEMPICRYALSSLL